MCGTSKTKTTEAMTEKGKRYYLENGDKYRQYGREYYWAHREEILKKQAAYRERKRATRTEAELQAEREYSRLRRLAMTPEEREKWRAYGRDYYRRKKLLKNGTKSTGETRGSQAAQ